jgi:hypothetical protein
MLCFDFNVYKIGIFLAARNNYNVIVMQALLFFGIETFEIT